MIKQNSVPSRLERILQLLRSLQSGPVFNATELADRFGVSRRTVFRDLNLLREVGLPIRFDEETEGYSLPDPHYSGHTCRFSESELSFLLLSVHFSPMSSVLKAGDLPEQITVKLLAPLPERKRNELRRLLRYASNEQHGDDVTEQQSGVLSNILEAIRTRRQIRIQFFDDKGSTPLQTKVAPYRLSAGVRIWRLTGRSSLHCGTKTFDVSRIEEVELTDETYTIPRGSFRPAGRRQKAASSSPANKGDNNGTARRHVRKVS